MQRDLKSLIAKMTLEEKAGLCSGLDSWRTKPVKRLGIPSIMMTDGPHGLRKEKNPDDPNQVMHESVPSTCFPSGAALASSWSRDAIGKAGAAIGEEAMANDVSIVLGPAINIKRWPLCGRNFEYLSEDPYLAGQLATSYIRNVQSKGVGTSLKHFAANNKERARLTTDTIVDERTLREIYLANYEAAVKNAQPWTVMCAYNKINGHFCSENKWLLSKVLRGDWGFEGFVMSDWGAVNERPDGVAAGLELEMPSSHGIGDKKIVEAVKNGKLPESVLDQAVERVLRIVFRAVDAKKPGATCDLEEHHKLARSIAAECMVLLKNEGVLPLKKGGKVAVIGGFAQNLRYQGGGSSHINPYKKDVPLDEIRAAAGTETEITYSEGYRLSENHEIMGAGFSDEDTPDEKLIREASEAAREADAAVVFAGLPDAFESEGYDRNHMRMPESHNLLIEEVSKVQKNVIVVLCNGSPVEMPWAGKVPAILDAYLGGQAGAGAIADILFGKVNPSGKLAETFPIRMNDTPTFLTLPGETDKTEYREGVFVGYRYYEKKDIKPAFPFGFGLSYTTFEYTSISADKTSMDDTEELNVKVKVKNTGAVAGKEVVELYVHDRHSGVLRPIKELKGFDKIELKPGEEKEVSFKLNKRSFAYFNEKIHDWYVDSGEYEILVGGSSVCTPLSAVVNVHSTRTIEKSFTRNSTLREVLGNAKGLEILRELLGEKMVENLPEFIMDMPIRNLFMFKPDFTDEKITKLIDQLNA